MSQRLRNLVLGQYREDDDSTFTHNGNEYRLNDFLAKAGDLPIQTFKVKDLRWMLDGEHPDESRVAKANLIYPILVTRDPVVGLVTIDGFHRVVKAVQEKRQFVTGKLIPQSWFSEVTPK